MKRNAVVAMFPVLVLGTVLALLAFDRGSHSVSDTVRPFLITVVPVWIAAAWGARTLLELPPS